MINFISLLLMFTATATQSIELPLNNPADWESLAYVNITPNKVSINNDALHISVRGSASPLIYKLDQPTYVVGIRVVASWDGKLIIPEGATQGNSGADDFVLKLGIVETGERTLNWFQKRIAADWVKRLYSLAPQGIGVSRINFLSTTQQQSLLGTQRSHPLNNILYENRITLLEEGSEFEMIYQFDEPKAVLGLWISSDGDDTGSNFDLIINNISLQTDTQVRD